MISEINDIPSVGDLIIIKDYTFYVCKFLKTSIGFCLEGIYSPKQWDGSQFASWKFSDWNYFLSSGQITLQKRKHLQ